jgi:hypothetical protein
MKRPSNDPDPLWHLGGFLLGLFLTASLFMMAADYAEPQASLLEQVGLTWQAYLLKATPISCFLGCLIASLFFRVGNQSRYALIRQIGRIRSLVRYVAFAGITLGAVLLLNLILFSSVQSLRLSGDIPWQSWSRIDKEAGGGVACVSDHSGTRLLFLEEKRAAVERALKRESIAAKE